MDYVPKKVKILVGPNFQLLPGTLLEEGKTVTKTTLGLKLVERREVQAWFGRAPLLSPCFAGPAGSG